MPAEITVVCPQCGNRMRSSSEHVGRQGRCPSCRSLIEIQPAGGTASLPSLHPEESRLMEIRQRTDTDVSALPSGLIGLLLTLVLYLLIFYPLREVAIGALFVRRGIIPYLATLLTCWGLAMLVLKYRAVKTQLSYAEQELQLIPLEIGLQITATNVSQFLEHLARMPSPQRNSILGRRIQAGLNATLGTDAGGEGLMSSMQLVTAGLSTAFDTTLLALSMAIVLLFPTESLRKTEYRMLDQIASFANEALLRRLSDDYQRPGPDELPESVRDTLDSAFREHQRWLSQWQTQVANLGQSVGGDFERAVRNIHRELADGEADRLRKMHDLSRILTRMFEQASDDATAHQETQARLSSLVEQFTLAADELRQHLPKSSDQPSAMQRADNGSMPDPFRDTVIGPPAGESVDGADHGSS